MDKELTFDDLELSPEIMDSLKAMGISGRHASLLATHHSLEDRIAALERLQMGI